MYYRPKVFGQNTTCPHSIRYVVWRLQTCIKPACNTCCWSVYMVPEHCMSKFTATSRGFPAIARLFCFHSHPPALWVVQWKLMSGCYSNRCTRLHHYVTKYRVGDQGVTGSAVASTTHALSDQLSLKNHAHSAETEIAPMWYDCYRPKSNVYRKCTFLRIRRRNLNRNSADLYRTYSRQVKCCPELPWS